MLAKVPKKRSDGRSSFASLLRYVSERETLDPETGEIIPASAFCETNCLSLKTAAAEMRAAAAMNGRVKDPVYHFVISWPEGESPNERQIFEAARAAIKTLGMDGHQYVAAIHRDTQNLHVHVMVNRVHPETERAVYPDRDYFHLDRCMRELEIAQGWSHDHGPYVVDTDGQGKKTVRRATAEERRKMNGVSPGGELERITGKESLQGYVERRLKDSLIRASSIPGARWDDVHGLLAAHGLELREKGQGLAIYSKADSKQTPVKASAIHQDLGRGRLEKKLGVFQSPSAMVASWPARQNYDAAKPVRDPAEREARKLARKAARADLIERYRQAKTEHRQAKSTISDAKQSREQGLAAVRAWQVEARARAKAVSDPVQRSLLIGLVTAEARLRREAAYAKSREEAKAGAFIARNDWISLQAEQGDEAAIAYLRGLRYAEERKRKRLENADENSIAAADNSQHDPRVDKRLSWLFDAATTSVAYSMSGRTVFRDTGPRIVFTEQADDAAILAALDLAVAKYGQRLSVTGSPAFTARVVALAAQRQLRVQFADEAMEATRKHHLAESMVRRFERPQSPKLPSVPADVLTPETVAAALQAKDASREYRAARPGEKVNGTVVSRAPIAIGGKNYWLIDGGPSLDGTKNVGVLVQDDRLLIHGRHYRVREQDRGR